MSNETIQQQGDNAIQANSKAELLEWLKSGSQTLGWDAILAVDRGTINNAFRDQYVQGASVEGGYPAVSAIVPLISPRYVIFSECVFGEPIISFENASILSSHSPVRMAIPVIGGRELEVEYGATPSVRAIKQCNVMARRVLEFDATLEIVAEPGSVGVMCVDLTKGTNYRLTSTGSETEQQVAGEALRVAFEQAWTPQQRRWVVSRVNSTPGELEVASFSIRSQAAPGATQRTAANYGDGAVVAFVTMRGGESGRYPGSESQLKYLVPGDGPLFTASVLINSKKFLLALGNSLFRSTNQWVNNAGRFEGFGNPGYQSLKSIGGEVWRDSNPHRANAGHWVKPLPGRGWSLWGGDRYPCSIRLSLIADSTGDLNVLRFGLSMNGCSDWLQVSTLDNFKFGSHEYFIRGGFEAKTKIVLDVVRQSISTTDVFDTVQSQTSISSPGYSTSMASWAEVSAVMTPLTAGRISVAGRKIGLRSTLLDLFPVNSLLFSGAYQVRLSEIASPNDFIMFGHVGTRPNTFVISTPLPIIAAGEIHRFGTTSSESGMTWAVDNLPGETCPVGRIHPQTGIYTTPSRSEIRGAQVRVHVTASKGAFTATALMTVVKQPLCVNPLIKYVQIGDYLDLSTSTLSAGTLTWSPVPDAQGQLIDSPLGAGYKRFVAPTVATRYKGVDLVKLRVTAGRESADAYVAVIHSPVAIQIRTDAMDTTGQTIRLSAWMTGEELPPEIVEWKVLGGAGTIDDEGVLSCPVNPQEPFVMVMATATEDNRSYFDYLLLPLPLAPLPDRPGRP